MLAAAAILTTMYGGWVLLTYGTSRIGIFFLGDGGSPWVAKILPVPPNLSPSPLFDQSLSSPTDSVGGDQSLSPQLSFVPENFKKFNLTFLSILTTFQLKTVPCVGGIFGLRRQWFQVPLIWLCPWHEPPPSDSVPDGDRKSSPKAGTPAQTKNFVKKTLGIFQCKQCRFPLPCIYPNNIYSTYVWCKCTQKNKK